MSICVLCNKNKHKLYKTIDESRIYECAGCKLVKIGNSKKIENKLTEIYDFDAYKERDSIFKDRLNKLADVISRYKKAGSVLEIGAGFGLLSSILIKKGIYRLTIVEPVLKQEYLSNYKYRLYKTDIDNFLNINQKKYDIILMFDVIEHMKDPLRVVGDLKRILKSNGILVIQTPNYKSLMQEIVKTWSWWMVEDHKWIFSNKSLNTLLKKGKLDIVFNRTYEDWYDFKKNLDGNFTNITSTYLRRPLKLIYFAIFTPLYFLIRPILWKKGYGGLIFTIAMKR